MHYHVQAILALAYLAAAVPTPEPASDPWADVLDPWGQYGKKPGQSKRSDIEPIQLIDDSATNSSTFSIGGITFTPNEVMQHAKRLNNIKNYVGKIPGCDKDSDPSLAGADRKGPYKIDQGIRIPKSGKDDECTTGKGADHCWTEYFLVEARVEYADWQNTASAINCPAGAKDTCSVAVSSLAQSCSITGTSSTSSSGWDFKLFELSAKLGFENKAEVGASGLSPTYHSAQETTKTDIMNVCRADTSTATCTWNNDGSDPKQRCHQVWYADRVLHVWGQSQRRCNKCSDSTGVQQKAGNGKTCVRGQLHFDFLMPINKLVHCNGKCGDTNPGLEKPKDEDKMAYKDFQGVIA